MSIRPKLIKTNKKTSSENFSVYPNPSNGRFTISLSKSTKSNLNNLIQVYDMKGTLIVSTKANVHDGDEMNLQVPKGIYILKYINTKNGEAESKKIIIQ